LNLGKRGTSDPTAVDAELHVEIARLKVELENMKANLKECVSKDAVERVARVAAQDVAFPAIATVEQKVLTLRQECGHAHEDLRGGFAEGMRRARQDVTTVHRLAESAAVDHWRRCCKTCSPSRTMTYVSCIAGLTAKPKKYASCIGNCSKNVKGSK